MTLRDDTAADPGRVAQGFVSVGDTAALAARGVTVLDPWSTLVSASVSFGAGVVLWPGTSLQVLEAGTLHVGAGSVLFPGVRILAKGGNVMIDEEAEIGEEGGFTVKAETQAVSILIGKGARLLGGGSLLLDNEIGPGAQVLGPIRMQKCRLDGGGTHRDADVDRRGGVLKGSGVARGCVVPRGHVIQAFGLFGDAPMRKQSFFHPS